MKIWIAVAASHIAIASLFLIHMPKKAPPSSHRLVAVETVKLQSPPKRIKKPVQHSELKAQKQASPLPEVEKCTEPVDTASCYRDEIAQRVALALTLPDYGQVSIAMTLKRSGEVAQVVVHTGVEKNRAYVSARLPHLSFPPFGEEFKGEEEHTFNLILQGL